MIFPLVRHLSTLHLLVLLAAGALVLASLLLFALRPPARRGWMPVIAVLGLFVIAAAFSVLKDRVHEGRPEWRNPAFKVVRNSESLALALVPFALAAFLSARAGRIFASGLGCLGLALLLLPGWAAIQSWNEVPSAQEAVMSIPGAGLLARDGFISAGRWLWCAGGLLLAVPTVLSLMRRRKDADAQDGAGLKWTLLGLGLSSLAMSVFFWHQGDLRHRDVANFLIGLTAMAAPLMVVSEGRLASLRWVQHALGLFGACIALWMLTGVADGNFESGKQRFQDLWLTMLLLYFMLLIPPALVLQLAARAVWLAWVRRARCARPA